MPPLQEFSSTLTPLRIPGDLRSDEALTRVSATSYFLLSIDHSDEMDLLNDPWTLQRFLSCLALKTLPECRWEETALDVLTRSPGAAAIFSCAICFENARHRTANGEALSAQRRVALQSALTVHRLSPDWFERSDSLVCFESLTRGWNRALYASPNRLRTRSELSAVLDPILASRVTGMPNEELVLKWRDALTSVVFELFENTQIHARFGYDRRTLKADVVRAILVRTVVVQTGGNPVLQKKLGAAVECLEISVVDSGVGFFGSKHKRALLASDSLAEEWTCLRECLDKHSEEAQHLPEGDPRGIGLYEVLRALHFLRGAIQVRSGRTKAYRSFFTGDHQIQMESRESRTRPGMPKVRMLDFDNPVRPSPTENTEVKGVAIRTLVPLGWL